MQRCQVEPNRWIWEGLRWSLRKAKGFKGKEQSAESEFVKWIGSLEFEEFGKSWELALNHLQWGELGVNEVLKVLQVSGKEDIAESLWWSLQQDATRFEEVSLITLVTVSDLLLAKPNPRALSYVAVCLAKKMMKIHRRRTETWSFQEDMDYCGNILRGIDFLHGLGPIGCHGFPDLGFLTRALHGSMYRASMRSLRGLRGSRALSGLQEPVLERQFSLGCFTPLVLAELGMLKMALEVEGDQFPQQTLNNK